MAQQSNLKSEFDLLFFILGLKDIGGQKTKEMLLNQRSN